MADEHREPSCLIHFKGESGVLTRFTGISLEKFLTCHKLRLGLDGEQREIAENTTHIAKDIQTTGDLRDITCNLHYHRSCYSKFTNLTSIRRAQTRSAKRQKDDEISNNENRNITTEVDQAESAPPKKFLRSSTVTSSFVKPRNEAVLPPICIICDEEHKFIIDPVGHLYIYDKLLLIELLFWHLFAVGRTHTILNVLVFLYNSFKSPIIHISRKWGQACM